MITLEQLKIALDSVGVDSTRIDSIVSTLRDLQADLDQIEVKGRQNLDSLLGCMMAIDAIIGIREVQ